MRHNANYRQNRPNGIEDIAIFPLTWPQSAILGFQIFKFLVADLLICIGIPNLIKMGGALSLIHI